MKTTTTNTRCATCHRYVDVDDARYHAPGCKETFTARITVYAACDCAMCKAGHRWFYCERPVTIAAYAVEACVDAPDQPTRKAIAEVEAMHPGTSLLFV